MDPTNSMASCAGSSFYLAFFHPLPLQHAGPATFTDLQCKPRGICRLSSGSFSPKPAVSCFSRTSISARPGSMVCVFFYCSWFLVLKVNSAVKLERPGECVQPIVKMAFTVLRCNAFPLAHSPLKSTSKIRDFKPNSVRCLCSMKEYKLPI